MLAVYRQVWIVQSSYNRTGYWLNGNNPFGSWWLQKAPVLPSDSTFAQETGLEITTFWETLKDRITSGTLTASSVKIAVGAVLWTGIVSTAYTTFAQTFGQRRVKPTDANLIYSLQPIFTAIFAYFLLGETMGMYGFVGGSVIGGAVLLAASPSMQSQPSKEGETEH